MIRNNKIRMPSKKGKVDKLLVMLGLLVCCCVGEMSAQAPIRRDYGSYPHGNTVPTPGSLSYGTRQNILTRGGNSGAYGSTSRDWYYQDGGVINLGIQFLDLEGGIVDMDRSEYYFAYNLGLGLRFGNYKDPVQFEFGFMPGYVASMCDAGNYYYNDRLSGFHLSTYGKLKVNIADMVSPFGNFKWYLSPTLYYNPCRIKEFERRFAVGFGFGFQGKNWDWQILHLKIPCGPKSEWDFISECSPKVFIGTSVSYYLQLF